MGTKIKQTQFESLTESQGRDMFQTPNYGVDIIFPFIDKLRISMNDSWDEFSIWECAQGEGKIVNRLLELGAKRVIGTDILYGMNFITDEKPLWWFDVIITNPPFSLKRKFYEKCKEYRKAFALLIPADYSGWVIDAIRFDNCEKIIPTRRIDFITPTGKSGVTGNTSNFHSLWLTWGFNLGKSETFIELTNDMKKNI
jgi:hypothetical protein